VQVERHVGPGEHGTGLGLAVTKELVALHGGRIWAENKPEGGAIFSFEIPLLESRSGQREVISVGVKSKSQI